MASYKRAIKTAIKTAGLNASDFYIGSERFESTLVNVRNNNAAMNKVAKALRAAGYAVTILTAGWGGYFAYVNESSQDIYRRELRMNNYD